MSLPDREHLESLSSRDLEEQRAYYENLIDGPELDKKTGDRAGDLLALISAILWERAPAKPKERQRPDSKIHSGSLVVHEHDSEVGNVGWILVNGHYLSNQEVEKLESRVADLDVSYNEMGIAFDDLKREKDVELAGVYAQLEAAQKELSTAREHACEYWYDGECHEQAESVESCEICGLPPDLCVCAERLRDKKKIRKSAVHDEAALGEEKGVTSEPTDEEIAEFDKLVLEAYQLHEFTWCVDAQSKRWTKGLQGKECLRCKEFVLLGGICDPL